MLWKKKEHSVRTFSDIIRGLQYSVNTAQQILERHHLYLLKKYFDDDGVPVMRQFKISDTQHLNVPEITLIRQNSLSIDELEIEFNARITAVELKEDLEKDDNTKKNFWLDRASFDVDFSTSSKNDNLLKVKIKFKTVTQPEGVSRVIDEFDKLVSPIDTQKE